MKKFIVKSTFLTIIVLMVGAIVFTTIFKPFYLAILPLVLIFFYTVTNLVHAYLLNVANKSGTKFSSQYMAISFIRMFFYLTIAIIYVIFNRENAKVFLINYLVLYAVYNAFEVIEFTKVVKPKVK